MFPLVWSRKKRSISSRHSSSPKSVPSTPVTPSTPTLPALPELNIKGAGIEVFHEDVFLISEIRVTNRPRASESDVVVVGAGPSGLMLATCLTRFGIKVEVIDNRAEKTPQGRADGIQPKTIETLRQMRLADRLLQKGVKVHDVCFWESTLEKPLHRVGREIHYPDIDSLDPYVLHVHQGVTESVFLDDLKERGIEVQRNITFVDFEYTTGPDGPKSPLNVTAKLNSNQARKAMRTKFIVGCDGAHSQVRKCIPGSRPIGAKHDAVWGVLDGEIETDFPDIWHKSVICSKDGGAILMTPRERNLTRTYVELIPESRESTSRKELCPEFVMERAKEIMHPYFIKWTSVEWFGRYQIGQRVATNFSDEYNKAFIVGDAAHTHSPKAGQGLNTSIHDSWNLAWKLNLEIRGLAKPCLLATYEEERRKIAQDLIHFDYEHASSFMTGDAYQLAESFKGNSRFISGIGAEYSINVLNIPMKNPNPGVLRPGCLLAPSKVIRYVDALPVDIQLDIPPLSQFRIYVFVRSLHACKLFLEVLSSVALSHTSFLGCITEAASASYSLHPPQAADSDGHIYPERYTPVSKIFTYALVTDTPREHFELTDLPPLFRQSMWTVYQDDVPELDTRGLTCMQKWLGDLALEEVAVVNVRPDGYVGCLQRWPVGNGESGVRAVRWMEEYFKGFMQA